MLIARVIIDGDCSSISFHTFMICHHGRAKALVETIVLKESVASAYHAVAGRRTSIHYPRGTGLYTDTRKLISVERRNDGT